MKFAMYAVASTAVAAGTISYAIQSKQQFYSTVVYLVTSKFSIVVLGNFALMLTVFVGRLAKSLFLGTLRAEEQELIYSNARFAITETCLALTIFHEELSMKVFALFTGLLFSKVFHWLSHSRVEFFERSEVTNRWSHARLVSLMALLLASDMFVLGMCTYMCMQHGPSVLILFGFEYAILGVSVAMTLVRYVLFVVDMQSGWAWQSKGGYVFLLEFLGEALRFILFVVFFGIIFTYYGIPLHIVRELYISYSNIRQRLEKYRNYRMLMKSLNSRFPDATSEELEEQGECIICRDPLTEGKKLECGHIFHLDCLRRWFQESNVCPVCKQTVSVDGPTHDHHHPAHVHAARQQRQRALEPQAVPQAQAQVQNGARDQQQEQEHLLQALEHEPGPTLQEEEGPAQPALQATSTPPTPASESAPGRPASQATSTPVRNLATEPTFGATPSSHGQASPSPVRTWATSSGGRSSAARARPTPSSPAARLSFGAPRASPMVSPPITPGAFGSTLPRTPFPTPALGQQHSPTPGATMLIRVVHGAGAQLAVSPEEALARSQASAAASDAASSLPVGITRHVPAGAVLIVQDVRLASGRDATCYATIDGDWVASANASGDVIVEEIPTPPPIVDMMSMTGMMVPPPLMFMGSPMHSPFSPVMAHMATGTPSTSAPSPRPSPGAEANTGAEIQVLRDEIRRLSLEVQRMRNTATFSRPAEDVPPAGQQEEPGGGGGADSSQQGLRRRHPALSGERSQSSL